jgi:hypothetical protein
MKILKKGKEKGGSKEKRGNEKKERTEVKDWFKKKKEN